MNLPNIFSTPQDPAKQLFFVIHIAASDVQAALWEVLEGRTHIITESSKNSWKDDETCIEAIDRSLQELGKESEDVKETLFALSSEWVSADGIIPQKKPLFQKITKELSLQAVGFVVTGEAVVQHIVQLGSPQLQMFFVEMSSHFLHVSLVKNGQISDTHKVGRSGESVSDLTEGFAHFKEKVFPTKILLFSSDITPEEVETAQQQLISHTWGEKYPFLHPPVVESYPAENILEVVVQTGGVAVAEAKGIPLIKESPLDPKPAAPPLMQDAELAQAPITEEPSSFDPSTALAQESGELLVAAPVLASETVVSSDLMVPPLETPHEAPLQHHAEPHSSHGAHAHTSHAVASHPHHASAHHSAHHSDHHHPDHHGLDFLHVHPPKIKVIPLLLAGVLAGLAILGMISVVAARSMMTAVVNVQLRPRSVQKDVELTLDPKVAQSDVQKQVLKAAVVTKRVDGQKSAETTGKKIIGDRAKGKATLFNRTTSSKSFPAGTVLKTGNLVYTLDQNTTIASASTGQNFETKPGTVEVAITAKEIGVESNIATNTDLVIENFSKDTYVGRTSSAIAGGTSREIEAVSQKDRDELQAALRKELTQKATTELTAASAGGTAIIPTNRVKVLSSTYSAEIGKEVNSLDLKMSLEVEALSYQAQDIKPLATQLLSAEVPTGYQLDSAEPDVMAAPISSSTASAQIKIQTSLSAQAFPEVSEETLKQEIKGKSVDEAERILKARPDLQSAEIVFTPPLFKSFYRSVPEETTKIIIRVAK